MDQSEKTAWQRLKRCSDKHCPVILGVEDWEHWIVAYGADEDGAWVMDPVDDDSPFAWWTRKKLLRYWWYEDEEDSGFQTLEVTPASDIAKERFRRAAVPPSSAMYNQINVLTLRDDLDRLFGASHSTTGVRAAGLAQICHIAAMPLEMLELLLRLERECPRISTWTPSKRWAWSRSSRSPYLRTNAQTTPWITSSWEGMRSG